MERTIIATGHYESKVVYLLSEAEFAQLSPLIEKGVMNKINSLRKRVEYYEGLRESCATEKQLDKWFCYTEKLDFFETLKRFIDKEKQIK